MKGLPTTPADTAKLAADVKDGEAPFVDATSKEISRVLLERYPQLRSASLLSANGDCSLIIRLDCNFAGNARKVKVGHHITIAGEVMPAAKVIDVRPVAKVSCNV